MVSIRFGIKESLLGLLIAQDLPVQNTLTDEFLKGDLISIGFIFLRLDIFFNIEKLNTNEQ